MQQSEKWSFLKMHLPELVLGLLVAITAFSVCLSTHWEELHVFLLKKSDPLGYYQFLPTLFIEGEMSQLPWAHYLFNGNSISMFQIGVAILQTPSFLIGHLFAWILGYPLSGYSSPYCVANFAGAAAYCGAAISLLALSIKPYFGRTIGIISAALLFLATNLFYYSAYQPGMSHVYSFFLVALVVYLTPRFWTEQKSWQLFALILSLGAIVLIRPYNGIVLFYFLFHNTAPQNIKARLQLIFTEWRTSVAAALIVLGFFCLQFAYWNLVTGELFVFTYSIKDEGFNWARPELWNVLFSHQNGWFMYHPLAFIALAGVVIAAIQKKHNGLLILVVWCMAWYVIASWWCWWFGGAFGHRAFLDILPLFAFPLGYLLKQLNENTSLWQRVSGYSVLLFLVYASVSMAQTYELDARPWDGNNWTWSDYTKVWRNLFL